MLYQLSYRRIFCLCRESNPGLLRESQLNKIFAVTNLDRLGLNLMLPLHHTDRFRGESHSRPHDISYPKEYKSCALLLSYETKITPMDKIHQRKHLSGSRTPSCDLKGRYVTITTIGEVLRPVDAGTAGNRTPVTGLKVRHTTNCITIPNISRPGIEPGTSRTTAERST